jgi:hypothetical protein
VAEVVRVAVALLATVSVPMAPVVHTGAGVGRRPNIAEAVHVAMALLETAYVLMAPVVHSGAGAGHRRSIAAETMKISRVVGTVVVSNSGFLARQFLVLGYDTFARPSNSFGQRKYL